MFALSPPPANSVPATIAKSATAASESPYGFDGAELCMTIADWRNASPRPTGSPCGSQTGRDGIITCVAADVPLGGSFAARNLTYRFADGKLVEISFQTSINGFDYATARLKRRYGEPSRIIRDSTTLADGAHVPHVAMIWSNARSTIRLSDPADKGTMLTVRFMIGPWKDAKPYRS